MTVTVRTIRNAAAMDVDISVWLYIKVFVILVCGSAHFPCCAFYIQSLWFFCHVFCMSAECKGILAQRELNMIFIGNLDTITALRLITESASDSLNEPYNINSEMDINIQSIVNTIFIRTVTRSTV